MAPAPTEIGGIISANTTINIAVPDPYIPVVFGHNGAVLVEIIRTSGAQVIVSQRPPLGQYVEGTNHRVVTITGAPACVNQAHMFIVDRLQAAAAAPAVALQGGTDIL